jgi:hypothetical protein
MDRREFCFIPAILAGCGGNDMEYPPFLPLGQEQFPAKDFIGIAKIELWTPTVTLSTPGTLSVTYVTQLGYFSKMGNLVFASFMVELSSWTEGTGSGLLLVAGLPYRADGNLVMGSMREWQGIVNGATRQFISPTLGAGDRSISFRASGGSSVSDVNPVNVNDTMVPGVSQIALMGGIIYQTGKFT